MASSAFGIDLGTGNIKIYSNVDDMILNEKNMIAIKNRSMLFSYGNAAYEMYEKAPANIVVSRPVNSGVIADIQNMQTLLRNFVNDICEGNLRQADYYISVPTDITEVEKRAFFDLVRDANIKAKKIMVVEKAIADGLGLDVDVKNSQGIMIVDIGYDTTEISILSLGGIVLSRLIKTGGQKLDESIRNIIRKEYNLMIGCKTAEKVKLSLAELEETGEDAIVYGRDIVTGLPVERNIPVTLVDKAMKEYIEAIVDNIKVILERTPPELGADIYRKGLYLTGGSAKVSHLNEVIAKGTGLKVNLADNASESVACGLAKIIKEDQYKSLAYSIMGMG